MVTIDKPNEENGNENANRQKRGRAKQNRGILFLKKHLYFSYIYMTSEKNFKTCPA